MSRLPGILEDIAHLVGLPAALAVADRFGGRRLPGLVRMSPDHPLARCVGLQKAIRIAEYLGNERPEIPKFDARHRAIRNRRIREERALGATHAELAERYHLTDRWIRAILAEKDEPVEQIGFDW
ncbi:MAG TPA: Mor transcription activator family protein [Methylococcus sp.]|nr:Mor transcription activator family protein [Methylococcus sp.]